MNEIHNTETSYNYSSNFDPDKRIERNDNISVRDSYNPDKRITTADNAVATSFFERLKAIDERNATYKAEVVLKNKIDGCAREEKVMAQLKAEYPESLGYKTIREAYLRDESGKIVIDKETGQARRIDFCVCKDGKVIKSIEVTSQTADKTKQLAKEDRIKEQGGVYIKDESGNLIKHSAQTEVWRCE